MNDSTLKQYIGFFHTPLLGNSIIPEQAEEQLLNNHINLPNENVVFKKQRLGKLVEEFLFYQLKQEKCITWICDNLQIQKESQTIGEIDAIFIEDNIPIHLEIVYKFYLYDTLQKYNSPLEYWIGPNRNDTLLYKLQKLKNKQFPLLYKDTTIKQINKLYPNINLTDVKQRLCFKAQLFLNHYNKNVNIHPLNAKCISGYYLSFNDFYIFKESYFFIPTKLDWLVKPHNNVEWLKYNSAIETIKLFTTKNKSPLLWIRTNGSKPEKYFITYW